MKALIVICLVVMASADYLENLRMIDDINERQDQWVAGPNKFTAMSDEEIQQYMGLEMTPIPPTPNPEAEILRDFITVPASFDSRTQWASCIHPIRDQAQCGSCWAFSGSEVLSDRTCIEGGDNVVLSAQDMVSCDTRDHGCQGGALQYTWLYMSESGIVPDACYPYASAQGQKVACSHSCTGSGEWKKYFAQSGSAKSFPSIDAIKQEVYTNGPVQTGFYVFADFMHYKSGIYKWDGVSKQVGGHAVKIVGWGSQNNVDYWIVANSWNTGWGLQGFFWYEMGQTKSMFEEMCYTGKARV